mgnify:CR=1 FL=1
MDLSKLLLLAGYAASAGVKRDREAAALEEKEKKEADIAKAEADEKERIRIDEQQMRYVYIDPQGNPGINAIGSPVKLPHGSKIIKMGNFKNGFQDYKGESKIDDLFNVNGVPMTKGQIATMTSTPQNTFIAQGVNAPKLDSKIQMQLGGKKYPYVGQVIDGKNHLMEASKSKMLTGPDLNTFETKYSIGGNIVSEKEAIRINQETGLPIRQITSAYTNGNLISTKEENYEEPGMQEGEKHYYVVGKSPSGKDQIIKRKSEADLISLGYSQDSILVGNFAGDRLVKQIAVAATGSTATEYQRPDGSTILDTDDNFTNDDRKNAVGQRLVEISADGKTVTPKGNFSSNVKQDTGKLQNAIDLSKYTAYMKLEDGTIVGKKDEQDINEGLTSINASLFNRLPEFKSKPELAKEFVAKFGPLIVQKLRPTIVQEGQVTANLTADAQNDALTIGYGAMLEIPGMMDYLRSVDLQGNVEKKRQLQTSMMNTNPDGTNVVVDEPITAPDGQEIGHLIYGKMATPKYKPFLENKLYPTLLAATNDPVKAKNLLATFIQDKVNPVTNEVIQRPDGNGPMVSENQPVIDNMQVMANTIIVPGRVETVGPPGDGQQQTVIKPVTELDGFMAMINAADPDSDPILAALDAPTKKRISNKAVAMANNDTEALLLTVRGLISVSGPYVTNLLNRKYGIDNSSQGQQRRNAFRTQTESTNRADRVVKSALFSYFNPVTGQPLPNTAVANLDLTFDGLKYLGTELVTRLRGAVGGEEFNATEIGDGIINQLLSGLTAQGIDPTEVFDQSAITAFRQDAAGVAESIRNADTEAKKLLAAREFHITVLAYELAAAIQGGTGGRTISDQDVALILGALKQNLTASPPSQRAALLAARDMLKEIRIRAQYLSSDNVLDNAAMAITDDMMSRADVIITPQSAAARIRKATATGQDLTAEMSDEDLLKVYNRALSLRNEPTVTELTDEIRNSELFKLSVEGLRRS